MRATDHPPVDLSRLTRPEADAFRYIAEALGARFAGDLVEPPERVEPTTIRLAATGTAPLIDARALLDRVPIAILIVVADAVEYMNRTAAALFGYTSATVLDAGGGLGALFDGKDSAPGVLNMVAADGRKFPAKVTMATIDWCGVRAMLFTVVPPTDVPTGLDRPAEPRPDPPRDALAALLDANPDPIAIVARGGVLEATNRAFDVVAPGARTLDERLAGDALQHVVDAMTLAFVVPDGVQTVAPVDLAGSRYTVSAGALRGGTLVCLVFHALEPSAAELAAPEQSTAGVEPDPPPVSPEPSLEVPAPRCPTSLWRAVTEARRLARDCAILLVASDDEANALAPQDDEADARLVRSTLLAVATRVSAGTVVRICRRGEAYAVTVSAAEASALHFAAASLRLGELAHAAGRVIAMNADGALFLAPAAGTD